MVHLLLLTSHLRNLSVKKLSFDFRILIVLAFCAFLASCGNLAYNKGVDANVKGNNRFADTQDKQLDTIQQCYMYSKDTTHCSILAAGTNATQILGGRPTPIRVASSDGEIAKSILSDGLDATVKIYGLKAVADTVKSMNNQAGKVEVLTQPEPIIVRPEVVQPVIVTVPAG